MKTPLLKICLLGCIVLGALGLVSAGFAVGNHQGSLSKIRTHCEWRIVRPNGLPRLSHEQLYKLIKPDDYQSLVFTLRDGTTISFVRTNL